MSSEPASIPDLQSEASDLRIATLRLARRMRTERAVDTMSDAQFTVLFALSTHGPRTLSQLAERESVSAPAMTRTVNCLQESGFVARTADEADGRKVVVTATAEGHAVVAETARRRDAWVEESLARLSADERETMTRAAEIMQRMVAR